MGITCPPTAHSLVGEHNPKQRRVTKRIGKDHWAVSGDKAFTGKEPYMQREAGEKGAYTQPHPKESREPGAQMGFKGRAGSGMGLRVLGLMPRALESLTGED